METLPDTAPAFSVLLNNTINNYKEKVLADNKLYKSVWYGVFAVLIILTVSTASCSVSNHAKTNETLSRMITEGINPKEAGCAVAIANGGGLEHTRLYCAIK